MSLRILTFVAAITVATASTALAQNSSSGPSSLSETYQDWRVACSGEGRIRRCAFSQTLRQQNGQRVLALEFTPDNDGSLTGALLLPFGLELSRGVSVGLDDKAPEPARRFKTCLQGGCVAPITVPVVSAKAYRSGTNLKLNMIASDTAKPVTFTISLKGFGQALDRTAALLK